MTVNNNDAPFLIHKNNANGCLWPQPHYKRFGLIYPVYPVYPVLLRGSVIGTLIGAIPGLGGTVASFLAYSSTVQTDKDPSSYGKGNIRGVIAPEAANNAKDGGSLIPTVAFGIPGSAETALFLGILVLHGIDPGPSILLYNEREIYGLIVAITAAAASCERRCSKALTSLSPLGPRMVMLSVTTTASSSSASASAGVVAAAGSDASALAAA